MNRLDISDIDALADQFIVSTQDKSKQSIVDSLGFHPVNHAEFMRRLCEKCAGVTYLYVLSDYRAATRNI